MSANSPVMLAPPIAELSLSSAIGRWSGVGPYYAMFPVRFAFEVVARYSRARGAVLDPFAGRASSIYAAVAQGRNGYGIEIHPVGWLYGSVKLAPAAKGRVTKRLDEIGKIADRVTQYKLEKLPQFFHLCYCKDVLKYLLAARENLRWKTSRRDATLMAMILVNLHGKRTQCLSNQMRQGKAMSPAYSVRWWKAKRMEPPKLDPIEFLKSKIDWRYAKGLPQLARGHIELGDSTSALKRLEGRRRTAGTPPFDLLFTSPPYFGITNYFYDQWLRMWMLGGSSVPTPTGNCWQRKFESKSDYRQLLKAVFEGCAESLKLNAVVYVRTDARQFTFETTHQILKDVFPKKRVAIVGRPFTKATQTALYGDKIGKPGEVDIVMH